MARLRSIQVLRGIAACAVVLLHSTTSTAYPFYWGAFGVDIFFVISGVIIGTVYERQPPLRFLANRLWRIYPMWWVAMLPWLAILGAVPIAVNLTLWPIWGGFNVPEPQVGWTLCFEILFYAGMFLASCTRPLVPLLLFGASLLASNVHPLFAFTGSPMIFEFLAGLIIARLPKKAFGAPLAILGALLMVGLSPEFYASATAIDPAQAAHRAALWGLPAAIIVHQLLALENSLKGRAVGALRFLGDASYSIYLFHVLVTSYLPAPWPLKFLGAIALGIIVHLLIERRLMKLRPDLHLRKRPAIAGDRGGAATGIGSGLADFAGRR